MACFQDVTTFFCLAVFSYFYQSKYTSCYYPIQFWQPIIWILCALIRIFAELIVDNVCKGCATIGVVISVCAIVEWVFHGFVWYILVMIRTPKCTNISNYIVLGIYFAIFFFIIGTVVVVFAGEVISKLRRMRYS
jgi:hypothetical protein